MKKNMTMWRIVGGILLMSMLVVGLMWANKTPDTSTKPDQHPLIGEKFVDFELKTDDGDTVNFASGKPMAVMFFASWCPYCNRGIDAYKEFAEERDDVNITLINTHVFEKSERHAPEFIKDKGVDFPVLYDKQGQYTTELDINSVPVNVILDKKGIVTDVIGGNISLENLGKVFPK